MAGGRDWSLQPSRWLFFVRRPIIRWEFYLGGRELLLMGDGDKKH